MKIEHLQKILKNLTISKSIDKVEHLLEEFNVENHNYEQEWFNQGIEHPTQDLYDKEFDKNSIISHSFDVIGGESAGFFYYKDIFTAITYEVCQSFTGIFSVWQGSGKPQLNPELLPIIQEQSKKLLTFIDKIKPPATQADLDKLSAILAKFTERHFEIFMTIQKYVKSWEKETLPYVNSKMLTVGWGENSFTYVPYSIPDEYKSDFGKDFTEINLDNTPEFIWALLKLPPSWYGQ